MRLEKSEKEVLEVLAERGESSPEEVAGEVGEDPDAVSGTLSGLEERGLVVVEEDVETLYSLGGEGEEALDEGLPERRVLEEIPEGGMEMSLVASLGDWASPAVGWLKRKGWAEIEGGVLKPTDEGKDALKEYGLDELVLEVLGKGEATAEELSEELGEEVSGVEEELDRLGDRGEMLGEREERSRRASITGEGREALEEGEVYEEKGRLTHEMLLDGSWREAEFREYDVTAEAEPRGTGKVHPYRRLLDRMREIFVSLGFEEIKSPTVESGFWNFDALFQPQDHPAREMQDTFYLSEPASLELPPEESVEAVEAVHRDGGETGSRGWGGEWSRGKAERALLRTHTTAATVRYLYDGPETPAKVFCIDRAYRRETIDATHLPQFYQLEGIVVDEDVTFRNLLGCLETFYGEMGFDDVRFRPAYFPYTEPSVEPEVYVEELGEWVELGGAGVFREEVTAPAGIDQPVLAWGLGAGRLAMLRLGLTDLRDLYVSDVDWLREEPICR